MNARPPATSTGPIELVTDDGVRLGGTVFAPLLPRAAVLIVGATATPHRYYRHLGAWLAERGFLVLAFDYRGIGASRVGSLRGHPATMRDWGTHDVDAALAALRARAPGLPLYAIGHSFGGQALGLSDALAGVDGLLTVGAQLGWYGHWSGLPRLRLWATWRLLFPGLLATFGYVPGWTGMGEDLPPGVASEWARWCSSRRYLVDHVVHAEARMRSFAGHAEVWAFDDDDYAPLRAVRAYASYVGPRGAFVRRVSRKRVGGRPIGHFGLFRPAFEATLWADVEDVLEAWLAAWPGRG